MRMPPLFEFELAPVDHIEPWGTPPSQSLSWFALTEGLFRMPVGTDVLLRYTPEALLHWGLAPASCDATYQVAAFARDVLGSVAAGAAPLPPLFELIASDLPLRRRLLGASSKASEQSPEARERGYVAWRWLGVRSPWMSYLVATPRFAFLRVGSEVHVAWDNSDVRVDGLKVWTAEAGVLVMPVEAFLTECRAFADRLLARMDERLEAIASGDARPRVSVEVGPLKEQRQVWAKEFAGYFGVHTPDVAWADAEAALLAIAREAGIPLAERG